MDVKKLLDSISANGFPVALGGCKNAKKTFGCCEYNITIFDGKSEYQNVI